MSIISIIMACFALLGATDRIIGNKFGLGKEFEKGIMMLGTLTLSMLGMIIISPVIADILNPMLMLLPVDPSIVPASLFACDMGGGHLASELAKTPEIGFFNGLVVASMMGCTISFTVPFALSSVNKEQHKDVLLGLLCGIVTLPIGSFIAGIFAKIPVFTLISNLIPLIIFSAVISFGLIKAPGLCVKIFNILGIFIKIIITIGLAIGIFEFLTGIELIKGIGDFNEGTAIIYNASAVMTGAFPLLYILEKVLSKPIRILSKKSKINEASSAGFIATLATSVTTFEKMKDMDRKGVILNSAFIVSASFLLTDHLAFTLAFKDSWLSAVLIGKLSAGLLAIPAAIFIYKRSIKNGA